MVTFDHDFLRLHATGIQHAGIAFIRPSARTVKAMIEMLRLLTELVAADEMHNRVEYL